MANKIKKILPGLSILRIKSAHFIFCNASQIIKFGDIIFGKILKI